MLTGKTNTLHSHPNLLPLREALIFAESGVPFRPPRVDSNEQRALQLIARMQARYKKVMPFLDLRDIPSPQGLRVNVPAMAGAHAG